MPILSKKIYVITSPDFLQSVFRSNCLSFEPFMLEFSQRLLGISNKIMEPTRRKLNTNSPRFVHQVIQEIHTSLTGKALTELSLHTLNSFVPAVNNISSPCTIQSLYIWLRSTLTMATTDSLFGLHNPMRSDPKIIHSYWYSIQFTPSL